MLWEVWGVVGAFVGAVGVVGNCGRCACLTLTTDPTVSGWGVGKWGMLGPQGAEGKWHLRYTTGRSRCLGRGGGGCTRNTSVRAGLVEAG